MEQKIILNKIGYLILTLIITSLAVFKLHNGFRNSDFILIPVISIILFILIELSMKKLNGKKFLENLDNSSNMIILAKPTMSVRLIGQNNGQFIGISTAISNDGSTIAFGSNTNFNVYTNNNNNWTFISGINLSMAVNSISISSNGNRIVVGMPNINNVNKSYGVVRVYEFINNIYTVIGELSGLSDSDNKWGMRVRISDNGNVIAFSTISNVIRVYNFINSTFDIRIGSNIASSSFVFDINSDGSSIAIIKEGGVQVLKNQNNNWVPKGNKFGQGITNLSISNDGNTIGTVDTNKSEFSIYKFNNDKWELFNFGKGIKSGNENFGKEIGISGNSKYFIVGASQSQNEEGYINLYDISSKNINSPLKRIYTRRGIQPGSEFGSSVSINTNGKYISVGSKNFSNSVGTVGEGFIFLMSYKLVSKNEYLAEEAAINKQFINDIRNQNCPTFGKSQNCPLSTKRCSNRIGLCYYPNKKQMVSTYYNKKNDFCPEINEGNKNNQPFKLDGVRVWKKNDGISKKCINLYAEEEQIIKKKREKERQEIRNKNCPPMSLATDCPPSTIKCSAKKGYCYNPKNNEMVSTYYDQTQHHCKETNENPNGKNPVLIDNQKVWPGKKGIDRTCSNLVAEEDEKIRNIKLAKRNKFCPPFGSSVDCPENTVKCKTKGYCYDKEKNQMVSTYFNINRDYCPDTLEGNSLNIPYVINNARVWKRKDKYDNGCMNEIIPQEAETDLMIPPVYAVLSGSNLSKIIPGVSPSTNLTCYDRPIKRKTKEIAPSKSSVIPPSKAAVIEPGKIFQLLEEKSKSRLASCPSQIAAPLCPVGTASCSQLPGYCFDFENDRVVRTFFEPSSDFCPETSEGYSLNQPTSISGTRVWIDYSKKASNCKIEEVRESMQNQFIQSSEIAPAPVVNYETILNKENEIENLADYIEITLANEEGRDPDVENGELLKELLEGEVENGSFRNMDLNSNAAKIRALEIARNMQKANQFALNDTFEQNLSRMMAEETGSQFANRFKDKNILMLPPSKSFKKEEKILNLFNDVQAKKIEADSKLTEANIANINASSNESSAKQSLAIATLSNDPVLKAKAKADKEFYNLSREEAKRLYNEAAEAKAEAVIAEKKYNEISKGKINFFQEEMPLIPMLNNISNTISPRSNVISPSSNARSPSSNARSPRRNVLSPRRNTISSIAPALATPKLPIARPLSPSNNIKLPEFLRKENIKENSIKKMLQEEGYISNKNKKCIRKTQDNSDVMNSNNYSDKPLNINVAFNYSVRGRESNISNRKKEFINKLKNMLKSSDGKNKLTDNERPRRRLSPKRRSGRNQERRTPSPRKGRRGSKSRSPSPRKGRRGSKSRSLSPRKGRRGSKSRTPSPIIRKRGLIRDMRPRRNSLRNLQREPYNKQIRTPAKPSRFDLRYGIHDVNKEELFRKMRQVNYPQNIERELRLPYSTYESEYEDRNKNMRNILRAQDDQSSFDKLKYNQDELQMNYETAVIKKILNEKSDPAPVLLESSWSEWAPVN